VPLIRVPRPRVRAASEIDFNGASVTHIVAVTYGDFAKLDLRVAKIKSAEPIPEKTRIIRGVIDLGDEERTVIIGGAQFYDPADLVGRTVVVVANLEPKRVAGVESDAMLLAADVDDRPFWLTVSEDVPAGTRIR